MCVPQVTGGEAAAPGLQVTSGPAAPATAGNATTPEGLVLPPLPLSPEAHTPATPANEGDSSPGPSGKVFPIFSKSSFKGPPTPARPSRQVFKVKKRVSKKRCVSNSATPTSDAKQKVLEQYFERQQANEKPERLDSLL